jgi:hypothetical protein
VTITIPLWLIWTLGIIGVLLAIPIVIFLGICAYVGYVLIVGKRALNKMLSQAERMKK